MKKYNHTIHCGSPGLMTILPRRTTAKSLCSDILNQQVGGKNPPKTHSLKEYISGHPLHWEDVHRQNKIRLSKSTEGTLIKVTIVTHQMESQETQSC